MTENITLFDFEHDFVATLRCIPMAVRFKLDACGVKLSLRQWSRFTQAQRRACLVQACGVSEEFAAYRERLAQVIADQTGEIAQSLPAGSTVPWDACGGTPTAITHFARSVGARALSDEDWTMLTPLKRFALLKLSRDNHDNVNFLPALREFGLYVSSPPAVDSKIMSS